MIDNILKFIKANKIDIFFWFIFAALIWFIYGIQGNNQEVYRHGQSAILWMVNRWDGSGGDLSHCWLIPLVSVGIIFWRRKEFAKAKLEPCYWGLPLIILCLVFHWVGFRTQLTRISLLTIIGLLWSVPLFIYGKDVAKLLLFPCAYLILSIPLSFMNQITFPLRIFASTCSVSMLNGIGIAAVKQGTMIYSSAGEGFNFNVADPCSGLRSILAMVAIAAAYGNLTQKVQWKKWALFCFSLPMAIIGNISRILIIAIIAQWKGDAVASFVHDYSDFIIFPVAVLLMIFVGELLKKVNFKKSKQEPENDS
ncbi:MAG: exosortase/archaeosortase family protein [Kiritimatiellae bacterium]|jgi:exosortase|nr:exosortase/archaeosortase family protein [Kiritimatiellia bacterium]